MLKIESTTVVRPGLGRRSVAVARDEAGKIVARVTAPSFKDMDLAAHMVADARAIVFRLAELECSQ
jgi:hypothetical protein